MLCQLCHDMLYRQRGRRGTGVGEECLSFSHHMTVDNLKASAEQAPCYLCSVIYDKLTASGSIHRDEWEKVPSGSTLLSASLYPFPDTEHLYRLDFKLNDDHVIASFVLKQKGKSPMVLAKPFEFVLTTSRRH